MKEKEINLIGDRFPEVYQEMMKRALSRHKNHEKILRDKIKKYKENLEFEQLEDISSMHSFSSYDHNTS